ncbi:MAG: lipoate protein ligase C-terminal domain-containing protein [Patescibacteria group bacterium]
MKAIYKVPNGKLLKVSAEADSNRILTDVRIAGDFFTYPEENIELLEKYLVGTGWNEADLTAKIEAFLKENPTEFFGLDVPSLVQTMLSAK